jgi:hypothetical protein
MRIINARGFNVVIQSGRTVVYESGDDVHTETMSASPEMLIDRVGLRLAISDSLLKGAAFDAVVVELSDVATERTLARVPGALLLDPDYSAALDVEEGLDPDPWVGFCRTVPSTWVRPLRAHTSLSVKLVTTGSWRELVSRAAQRAEDAGADFQVVVRPIVLLVPAESLDYDENFERCRHDDNLNRDSLYKLLRGPWSNPNDLFTGRGVSYVQLGSHLGSVLGCEIRRSHINAFIEWCEDHGVASRHHGQGWISFSYAAIETLLALNL